MSVARISLLGFMRYDQGIFDEVVLPHAPFAPYFTENNIPIEPPDKELLVSHILRRTANLEIFYPSIQTLRSALRVWSLTNAHKWQKLWETMYYQYNPIWNKDAHYTEHEHYARDFNDAYTENTTDTKSAAQDEDIRDTSTRNALNNYHTLDNYHRTNKVSAFNVDDLQPRERDDSMDDKMQTDEINDGTEYTRDRSQTDTETDTGTKTSSADATGTHDIDRTRREWGNIGVMTTQDMLKSERDLAMFSWYDVVCDSFIAEFCIEVF